MELFCAVPFVRNQNRLWLAGPLRPEGRPRHAGNTTRCTRVENITFKCTVNMFGPAIHDILLRDRIIDNTVQRIAGKFHQQRIVGFVPVNPILRSNHPDATHPLAGSPGMIGHQIAISFAVRFRHIKNTRPAGSFVRDPFPDNIILFAPFPIKEPQLRTVPVQTIFRFRIGNRIIGADVFPLCIQSGSMRLIPHLKLPGLGISTHINIAAIIGNQRVPGMFLGRMKNAFHHLLLVLQRIVIINDITIEHKLRCRADLNRLCRQTPRLCHNELW